MILTDFNFSYNNINNFTSFKMNIAFSEFIIIILKLRNYF
jgi:hypothetical protein